MRRYVAKSRDAAPREEDLDRIRNAPGVTILDHAVGGALLLEASEEAVAVLREELDDWIVAEEATHPRPSPASEQLGPDT